MNDRDPRIPREDLSEYQQFLPLRGTSIGIREASREYNIPQPTISRWVRAGYIAVIGTGPRRQKLLDKADVAFCAYIYHNREGGQGKWLFSKGGHPYTPKDQ